MASFLWKGNGQEREWMQEQGAGWQLCRWLTERKEKLKTAIMILSDVDMGRYDSFLHPP